MAASPSGRPASLPPPLSALIGRRPALPLFAAAPLCPGTGGAVGRSVDRSVWAGKASRGALPAPPPALAASTAVWDGGDAPAAAAGGGASGADAEPSLADIMGYDDEL